MGVAFVVLAHTEPQTLAELLPELAPHPTFVHIDSAALDAEYIAQAKATQYQHVVLSQRPRCLHWGGYSILRAMMETLELALNSTPASIGHLAFISGQCFPLRPVAEFADYLETTRAPVLCRAYDMAGHSGTSMGMKRLTHRHWLDGHVGHVRKQTPRAFGGTIRRGMIATTNFLPVRPPSITHACGSQWVALPRELGSEIVTHYRRGGFAYLRNSYAPDEIAIPTYVYNSRWANFTPNAQLEPPAGDKMSAYANYHWLRESMRGTIDDDDLASARHSRQYFLRKISAQEHPGVIERIRASW